MESVIKKVLVTQDEIETIVSRLAEEINRDYADKKLVIVSVLKGSVLFTADLVKKITVVNEMEFMRVSTYGNSTESSGEMKVLLDFDRDDFAECDFLIVEDIVDSGNTLSKLVKNFKGRGAKSVKTCTLLDKPARRKVEFVPDYVGKVIPDEFVFGYGLDLFEEYRGLPYVAVVSDEYLNSLH
ncbi:MAG: hypoxanthine phosphoribosyltransferase [Oscillospiraceae bacterium]|nr:hypoxanthine phosphoribosyltransferase [Oscillospiraceae bacterium]